MDTPKHHAGRRHWSGRRPRSFIASEALSHTWWQVKDSNLRSFRDGTTDYRLRTRDQPIRLTRKQIPGVFTEESRREPTSPVANLTRHRLPSPRLLTGLTSCS